MADLAVVQDGQYTSADQIAKPIRDRIRAAREARKPLELVWQSNLAFAAGKFWLKIDRDQRRLVFPPELYGKDLYTEDVISEYRDTALGELSSDDERQQLLLRRDDEASEEFQAAVNRALGFGWDHEWDGDAAIEQARELAIDLGTSAIRCRWEPNHGPVVGEVPHVGGEPVYSPDEQYQLADQFSEGVIPGVQMKPVRQGRICWEPVSAFNILTPPGIPREDMFDWEGIVRPALLSDVKGEFGQAAANLKEDTDIGNALGLDINSEVGDARGWGGGAGDGSSTRVKDHVWLYTYYERPSSKWPKGRTVTLAGNKLTLLDHKDELPYMSPTGEYRSGISYFHWRRVTGRFWGRALIEVMKDPQRSINKRRTQMNQIIDRGLPFVIVEEGSGLENRKGVPVEVLSVKPQSSGPPVVSQGVGPGTWMRDDIELIREGLEHATGIRAARLGENPANVGTYSQLALIYEADQTKRQQIVRQHKRAISRLIEDSVYDMRRYWGPERQIMLAGDEDRAESETFNATQIPSFFIVQPAKGTTQPRTQAAKLKLIDDIAEFALQSGVVALDPPAWVQWRKESMDAGEPLELPHADADDQQQKAQLENHRILLGEQVAPAYYDPIHVHLPVHRSAQIQAEAAGDQQAWARLEQHVQWHLANEQANAARLAQVIPPGSLAPPQPPASQGSQGGQRA